MRGQRRAVGPAHFGRLRDRDQHRGFAEREAFWLLAEISERGRARTFEIAAIGREREIEREDVVLAQALLELHRAHRLAQLRKERAVGARLQKARDLHGDGRAARHDAAMRHELRGGARDRERIDADVLAEALVFVSDQQVEIARVNVSDGRGQPPAPVRRRIGPQQAPVAVDHDGGELERLAERNGPEGIDPGAESGGADELPAAALRVRLRAVGATNAVCSPPPCGEGLGVGVGRRSRGPPHLATPLRSAPPPQGGRESRAGAHAASLTSPPRPRPSRRRCGRSDRDDTCPRCRPAAARICRATPRARCRRP